MASRYWVGSAGDGDWNNVNNWSASSSGASGASVPVSTTDVYILDSLSDITGNLNQTSVNLNSLTISFGGTIGTSVSSLVIGVSGTTIVSTTSSRISLSGGTNPIASCKVRYCGNFYAGGGTFTALELGRNGYTNIDPSCVVTTLTGTGMACYAGANATAITTVNWHSGNLVSDRSIATLNEYGPTSNVILNKAAAVSTLANVFGSSSYTHNSSGTITNIKVGVGSKATAKGSIYPLTVTDSTVYGNGYLFAQEDIPVTFTNATTKVGLN